MTDRRLSTENMMAGRRFRFGAQIRVANSAAEWVEKVRIAETFGYDVLTLPDHFGDQFGPFSALAIAAASTSRLRVGMLLLGNDFRHPAITAKECATLDVLSEGRLELGIGAGWMLTDYSRLGIPLDRPAVRIERLEEGVITLRGMFADGPFSFAGRHYQIADYDGQPKPVQRPAPPILIGGGGRKVLSVAGRVADIVGLHVELGGKSGVADAGARAGADATKEKIEWVREAAGERFPRLELQVGIFLAGVDRPAHEVAREAEGRFSIPGALVAGSPHVLSGSVDEVVEALRSRRERFGISYLTIQETDIKGFAPVVARLSGT